MSAPICAATLGQPPKECWRLPCQESNTCKLMKEYSEKVTGRPQQKVADSLQLIEVSATL